MKNFSLSLLLFLSIVISAAGQTAIAKLKYEEAEEAYVKEDYQNTLLKLEEAEKKFGKVNPPIVYLRVMSQYHLLARNPHEDFKLLQSLRKNCQYYLKEYAAVSSIEDKYKEVYQIADYLEIYSHNQNFFTARAYYYGKGVPLDYSKAKIFCEKAIAEGDHHAMNLLGIIYDNGSGVEKDFQKAMEWFQKAADKGNVFAMINMAREYLMGIDLPKDDVKALSLYHQAADKGYPEAMYNLGVQYEYGGNLIQKDYTKAMEWYQKAAIRNHSEAMFQIAFAYATGQGVSKDNKLYIEWLIRSAKAGSTIGMYNLANSYKKGQGVEKNELKFMEWMTKSAEGGYIDAMYTMGVYSEGQLQISWYEKAAEKGHFEAMIALGKIYNGSTFQDEKKSFYWYSKASVDPKFSGYNMKNLGLFYEKGMGGVSIDYAKAMDWYQKSVAKGHEGTWVSIGDLYKNGLGVKKDYAKALECYTKNIGSEIAIDKIADLYWEGGPGLNQNYKLAIQYYTNAAEKGNLASIEKLIELYEKGEVVKKNQKKADEWRLKLNELRKK